MSLTSDTVAERCSMPDLHASVLRSHSLFPFIVVLTINTSFVMHFAKSTTHTLRVRARSLQGNVLLLVFSTFPSPIIPVGSGYFLSFTRLTLLHFYYVRPAWQHDAGLKSLIRLSCQSFIPSHLIQFNKKITRKPINSTFLEEIQMMVQTWRLFSSSFSLGTRSSSFSDSQTSGYQRNFSHRSNQPFDGLRRKTGKERGCKRRSGVKVGI